jgi:methylglutamate dehydrogenase subunit C
MTGFRRTEKSGRIDRSHVIAFSYNGKRLTGYAGDTIASALLANDQNLIARSFKYHRPRGFLAAGLEEPNGLFTIGEGADTIPNVCGPATALCESMNVRSQNAWPSPRFDLMAVNGLLSPVFTAGFYYKTFMGPRKGSWMFYESFIRKAAGLGSATKEKNETRYDTSNSFCDVLVIGSGPAGLSAALMAGRAGARVVLAEQDFEFGGSLLSSDSPQLETWRRNAIKELQSLSNVRVLRSATVQGLFDHNQAVLSVGSNRTETVQAKTIIHCPGAFERPLAFQNNDVPGVMLAGALRTYLNRYGLAPKQRAVIFTNNDSAYQAAFDLAEAGVAITMRRSLASPFSRQAASPMFWAARQCRPSKSAGVTP